MNTVVPILILTGLAGLAGFVCHRSVPRFWLATLLATFVAGVVWASGVYVLLWLTAPNELGPPLLRPILLILGTSFLPAAVVGAVMRRQPTA
jgi:hypothetical protein